MSLSTSNGHRNGNSGDDPQGLLWLATRYMEALRVRHFSERTCSMREAMLGYFRAFCEALGITQARAVTRAVILNYQSYLYHRRRVRRVEGGPPQEVALAVGTQAQRLVAVQMFFRWLTQEGLILYNPASDLVLPRKESRLPRTILSVAEVEKLMGVPDLSTPMGLRDRAILEVFYSTGLRRAEVCDLELSHVDFDNGVVRVVQGKGAKDRVCPIGRRALRWLEKYLVDVRPRLCPSLSQTAVFLNSEGERIRPPALGEIVHRLVDKAALGKRGSCHLLRHAFATALLGNGCDIRHIQVMLGHTRLETTAIYTRVTIGELLRAHERCHPARLPHGEAKMPEAGAPSPMSEEEGEPASSKNPSF